MVNTNQFHNREHSAKETSSARLSKALPSVPEYQDDLLRLASMAFPLATRAPERLQPSHVLVLQRTIGNRAFNDLPRRQVGSVQRAEQEEEETADSSSIGTDMDAFDALAADASVDTPAADIETREEEETAETAGAQLQMALYLIETLRVARQPEGTGKGGRLPAGKVKLLFVPDEKIDSEGPLGVIHVLVQGKEVARFYARGGPPKRSRDVVNPGHWYAPTPAGSSTLGGGASVVNLGKPGEKFTGWKFSQLAWGTALKDDGSDVKYQRGKRWISTTKLRGKITRDDIGQAEVYKALFLAITAKTVDPTKIVRGADGWPEVYYSGNRFEAHVMGDFPIIAAIPNNWDLNDFGEIGFRVKGTKAFIHTTAESEAQHRLKQPETLTFSHGCIHIKPSDRETMVTRGYLRAGVKIVIRKFRPKSKWGTPP